MLYVNFMIYVYFVLTLLVEDGNLALTLATSCYISLRLNWPTLATALASIIFLNYMYLLGENGGHGVDTGDILLHEQ